MFAAGKNMARTKKDRHIQKAPHFIGFLPQGIQKNSGTEVIINFEEYEALKLCDYELMTQAEAAILMNISRPTFTRIYESVRRKIAKAFVEGSGIQFEGGNVAMMHWYKCTNCKISFSLPDASENSCPFCKSADLIHNI